ncbi:MAG: hypothetical protein ACT4O4_05565 [Nitrospiraceae bacterium]
MSDHRFNPINQYRPDNPLHPINAMEHVLEATPHQSFVLHQA